MWDDPIPSVEEDAQPFEEADPAANVAWTDGQVMRLEKEWHGAQRSFAYHPAISVTPLRGDPPHEYQFDYRLRTLVMNEAGELQYVDEVSMHVWLPPGFPNQAPVARPMAGVFHPNIAWEGVYLTRPWQTTDSLVDFAARIGELLAYRSYDPESVVNATAMEWLQQNAGMLPLDSRVDFSAYAGGEPLGRIMRLGPATLETVRRALDDMRFVLLAEQGAPSPTEVEDFARQTRAALSLFLDSDVSDNLREQASEFDDWCRELPGSIPLWDYLRHQRTCATRAEMSATAVRNSAAAFNVALKELEKLAGGVVANSPAAAVKVIPSMRKLSPLQLKLPPLAREFEEHAAELHGLILAMKELAPEVPIAADGSLGRRLAAQGEMVREAVESASRTGQAALAETDALLRRARPEIQALEQVVGWREYMDMFAKARALEKQVTEWGSVGVQAFFLSNSSGSFGPFQFEEPLDLGGTRVVIRNMQRGQIEVIDAVGQDVLGRSSDGTVNVVLGAVEGSPGHQTQFTLTERCDDLTVQFNFIQKQTIDALSSLQRAVAGATSWCGQISKLLSDNHQQQNLREAHRKATHRWKALMTDLALLSRFKERLATYRLVERMSDEVPRVKELIARAKARLKDSTEKVQLIMGKSSRDVETDQLIVPPKLAKAYSDELRVRDMAKHEIARFENLLKQIARELAARLSSQRMCGRPEVPRFRALAPIPEALVELEAAMSDDGVGALVATLGGHLGIALPFNPPPAPETRQAIARPARPDVTSVDGGSHSAGAASRPAAPATVEAEAEQDSGMPARDAFAGGSQDAEPLAAAEYEEGAPQDEIIADFFGKDA